MLSESKASLSEDVNNSFSFSDKKLAAGTASVAWFNNAGGDSSAKAETRTGPDRKSLTASRYAVSPVRGSMNTKYLPSK